MPPKAESSTAYRDKSAEEDDDDDFDDLDGLSLPLQALGVEAHTRCPRFI